MAALASSLLRRGKIAARHASEAPGGAIRSAAPRRARCRVAAAAAAGGGASEGGGGRHVVVAGGGAAGLTAAYFAAARGARVTVLEKMSETGKKILISGGSRCNVLPSEVDLARDYFTSARPGAMKQAFATWSLDGAQRWLENLGLVMEIEESTGKYFPESGSAREVRDVILHGCLDRGVKVRYESSVVGLRRQSPGHTGGEDAVQCGWVCELADGEEVTADRVILAMGGSSFPKIGTTGEGYQLLKRLGHSLIGPYPALTPLVGPHPGDAKLAGISLEVDLAVRLAAETRKKGDARIRRRAGKTRAIESNRPGLLFTHRGYSGPAVLDASHMAVLAMEEARSNGGESTAGDGTEPPLLPPVEINWTGASRAQWAETLAKANGPGYSPLVAGRLKRALPNRLADALTVEVGLPVDARVAELRKDHREALLDALTKYRLPYTGHRGYGLAEVTGGGVPLTEVDVRTWESNLLPGVHIVGELLDCFGRIGGYNFFSAWTFGRAAGFAAASSEGTVARPDDDLD